MLNKKKLESMDGGLIAILLVAVLALALSNVFQDKFETKPTNDGHYIQQPRHFQRGTIK